MEDGKHERDVISKTFKDGMLEVGDGHAIYWHSHGNPAAPTVVIRVRLGGYLDRRIRLDRTATRHPGMDQRLARPAALSRIDIIEIATT